MIDIEVYDDGLAIRMKGHAGYAEYGKDIICASASILLYTAEETMRKMAREDKCHYDVVCSPGDSFLHCHPKIGYEKDCRDALRVILNGYYLLAQNYPDYITLGTA